MFFILSAMKSHESFSLNPKQVQQLKILVSQGEGASLEFKRKASFPEKIVREMIAFANTKGGIVLIGIGDDGSLWELCRACRWCYRPKIIKLIIST